MFGNMGMSNNPFANNPMAGLGQKRADQVKAQMATQRSTLGDSQPTPFGGMLKFKSKAQSQTFMGDDGGSNVLR